MGVGQQAGSSDNSSELIQQSLLFFFPSKAEVCSADKSNAFGKITLRFSFLTNGSGSENQVTIVQGSVNCGNNRKAGEDRLFKETAQGRKKKRNPKTGSLTANAN